VSFDDCGDNITTLTPFQKRHKEVFGFPFLFFKDSWHKGRKLSTKMTKQFNKVWQEFQMNPILKIQRYRMLLGEVFSECDFKVSNILQLYIALNK